MAEDRASPSQEIEEEEEAGSSQSDMYISHRVSRLDNLAGLAIKYNVTVADIKRANGLLSDTAMFAKDTLQIPTRSLSVGPEYSTWAGMIVTQYGRIPGDHNRAGTALTFGSESPPKQSAALDQLQRYYGTGDTSSEPSNFRPGDPEGPDGSVSGAEIELSEMDQLGKLAYRHENEPALSPEAAEYAGSRSGLLADERLRRRKAGEVSANTSPLRGSEDGGASGGLSPERAQGGASSSRAESMMQQNGMQHRRAMSNAQPINRRESLMDRLKRVASQPALAIPQVSSLARISDTVIAPIADALPPRPPGNRPRERSSPALLPARAPSKEGRKAD